MAHGKKGNASMSIDSIKNSIVNTAYNAVFSKAVEKKEAGNAAKAETAVLKGEGMVVSESPCGVAAVVRRPARPAAGSAARAEVIGMMHLNAELLESFAGELQAIATALGLEPPPKGGMGPVERMDLKSVVKMANDAVGKTRVNHENAALGAASGTEHVESTYFSLYELMALMLEIGQQQRNAAFELAMANLELAVSSIEAQATKQRRAGEYGMIVGIVTCALQIGVQAVAMGMQIKSLNAAEKTSVGQKNIEAQNTVKTTEAAMKSPEAAAKNTKKIEAKTSGKNRLKVEENMAKSTEAGEKYRELEGQMKESLDVKAKAEEAIAGKTKKICDNSNKIDENNAKINENNARLNDSDPKTAPTAGERTEIEKQNAELAKENEKLGSENDRLNGEIKKCQGDVDAADQTIKDLEPKLEAAKTEYVEALDAEMAKMNEAYDKQAELTDAAESKYHDEYKVTGLRTNYRNSSDVKTQRAAQRDLGQQRSLMEAKVMEAKAGLGMKPSEGDLEFAQLKQSKIEASCVTNRSYKTANIKHQAAMAMNLAPQMLGQLGQSISGMVTAVQNAGATLEGANQKEADFNLDQTRQLYNQAQDLITTARETLKAIYQAESQLNQKIIQA